jgi:hypothetical protein
MENNDRTSDEMVTPVTPRYNLMEALFKGQTPLLTLDKHQIHIVNSRYVLVHVQLVGVLQQDEITYIDTFDNLQSAVNGYLVDAQILP